MFFVRFLHVTKKTENSKYSPMFEARHRHMSNQTLNDMSSSVRSLSEISESDTRHFGVDLVSAARRNIGFLRSVSECQWLHQRATIAEAIRR